MKKLNQLLDSFSGTAPLFPLPEFVFFPQTTQPFHIFEPRYQELIRDIDDGDRLLIMALLNQEEGQSGNREPAFHSVATLGYLNQFDERDDQTLDVLITGIVKVETAEVDSDKPYRRVAATPQPEFSQVPHGDERRRALISRFTDLLDMPSNAGLELLKDAQVPLEMLAHIIATALPIPAEEKQKLLELQSLELRIEILQNFMDSGLQATTQIGDLEVIIPSHPLWN